MICLPQPLLTVVTGPSRSGKSEWAEHLAASSGRAVVYIATSQVDPQDAEWQRRLALHRVRRPADWQLQEVPLDLVGALGRGERDRCLLIDSLGTWLANRLEQDDAAWEASLAELIDALQQTPAQVILVAEAVGWSLVPTHPLGRRFSDRLGQLTRQTSAIAQQVYLVTAGFALDLRQLGCLVPPGSDLGR